MKNKNFKIDDFIKNAVDGIDYEFNQNEWDNFEKKLNKNKRTSNIKRNSIIIASAVLISSLTAIYVYNNPSNDNSNISNKNVIINQKNDINNSNNSNENIINVEAKSNSVNDIETANNIEQNKIKVTSVKQQVIEKNIVTPNNSEKIIDKKDDKNISNKDSVKYNSNINIKATKYLGCVSQTISFYAENTKGISNYKWNFGDNNISNEQSPKHTFIKEGAYNVTLEVKLTNGQIITIKAENPIVINKAPKAKFDYEPNLNKIKFVNNSYKGNLYKWSFGDGGESDEKNPVHVFNKEGKYVISLVTKSREGCVSEFSKEVIATVEHNIPMANTFTPNGDDLNETYGPKYENVKEYTMFTFKIFDKNKNMVFVTDNPQIQWDGISMVNRQECADGEYVYQIITKDVFDNIKTKKGFVLLKRN